MADQVFLGTVWTNTDNDPLVVGDVLIRDLAVNNGAKRTTVVGSTVGVGFALTAADPGQQTQVASIIGQRVKARILTGSAVARGDRLVTDSTEGLVRVDNAATLDKVLLIATSAKSAGVGTTIEGIIVAGALGSGGVGASDPLASYVTAIVEAGLTNERVLTTTATIVVTDGGPGGSITLDIPNNAVSDGILRNSAGFSVIGKSTTGTGDPADIIADLEDKSLFRGPSTLGFDFIRKLVKSLQLAGILSPASIGANQNDYNPLGIVDATDLRLTSSAGFDITGIGDVGSPGHGTGRILVLHNVGANPLTLKNASASSVAANRFLFPNGDLVLSAEDSVALFYDATTARWRRLDSTGGTSGGAAPNSASYITVAAEGSLSSERVLTGSATVSVTDGGATITVAVPDDAITNAKLRNSAGVSVIGKFDAGTGDPADIVADADDKSLFRAGGAVSFDYLRKLTKSVLFTGLLTPAVLTANQDNYNPTGMADASVLILEADGLATYTISGIAGGSSGRLLIIRNITASGDSFPGITLLSDGAGSTATNRFYFETDFGLGPQQSVILQYTSDPAFTAGWYPVQEIREGTISNAMLRVGGANSVIGRSAASQGEVADILAVTDRVFLGRQDNVVGFFTPDKLAEDLSLTGIISPTSLATSQNDYNPTGLATASTIRQDASANVNVTGLADGATGRIIIFHNVSTTNTITLKNQDTGSTAANRFIQHADILLSPNHSALLQYDATSSRWRAAAIGRIDAQLFGQNTTNIGNITTGSDPTHTYTFPANTLAVDGESIEAEFLLLFAANGNLKRVNLEWDSINDLIDTGLVAQNGGTMLVKTRIVRLSATTQRVHTQAFFEATTPSFQSVYSKYIEPGATLTGAVTLTMMVEGTATDDVVCRYSRSVWSPAP